MPVFDKTNSTVLPWKQYKEKIRSFIQVLNGCKKKGKLTIKCTIHRDLKKFCSIEENAKWAGGVILQTPKAVKFSYILALFLQHSNLKRSWGAPSQTKVTH